MAAVQLFEDVAKVTKMPMSTAHTYTAGFSPRMAVYLNAGHSVNIAGVGIISLQKSAETKSSDGTTSKTATKPKVIFEASSELLQSLA